MKKFVTVFLRLIFFIVLIGAIVFGGYFGWKKFTQVKTEKLHTAVSRTLTACAELTLYKMSYTDVVAIKKSAALGLAKSYSIVKYSGLLRAGIKNFEDIIFTISDDRKTITVSIPPSELLGNDIVTMRVFDEKNNIFVPINTQEIFDEIEEAKDESAKEILAEGLLDDADNRAELYIKQVLTSFGFESIEIEK